MDLSKSVGKSGQHWHTLNDVSLLVFTEFFFKRKNNFIEQCKSALCYFNSCLWTKTLSSFIASYICKGYYSLENVKADWKVFEIVCIMGHVLCTHNFQPFLIEYFSSSFTDLETRSLRTKVVSISLRSLTWNVFKMQKEALSTETIVLC